MNKKTITDLDVKNKRVLVRVDFNVPLDKGQVADDTRIVAALPSIKYLIQHGARVILMSHLGRPKGKVNPKYSLKPVVARLSELLGQPVAFAPDCVGPEAERMSRELTDGGVCCSKTCASIPRRKPTIPASRVSWPRWPTSTSTTLSAARTARTLPPRASPGRCRRRPPACSWRRS